MRLGNPQLAKAAKRDVAAVRANARQFAANVLPIIEEIERAGVTSHNAIAAKLNERNVRTARGGKWTPRCCALSPKARPPFKTAKVAAAVRRSQRKAGLEKQARKE